MAGVNKVILVGRLGRDPQIKYMPSGDAVCNFSIATSENWSDKQTGEKREKTEWHNIVTFRRLAEICSQYLTKGKQVYIEGKLQTRSWEKDGATHYMTEIYANTMQMLGSRDDAGQAPQRQGGNFGQQANQYNQPAPQQNNYNQQQQPPSPPQQFPEGPDDDIPF